MQRGRPGIERPRIPPEVEGIQANFCKNPGCANFGVPAIDAPQKGKGIQRDNYILETRGPHRPVLTCKLCRERPPIKSNRAIAEEFQRIASYLLPKPEPSCRTESCGNHGKGVISFSDCYHNFGRTKSGSQRYKCKKCEKTFSVGGPLLRQRKRHENEIIFKLLDLRVEVLTLLISMIITSSQRTNRSCSSPVISRLQQAAGTGEHCVSVITLPTFHRIFTIILYRKKVGMSSTNPRVIASCQKS